MATLDVSDILTDPEFVTCFSVARTATVRGQNGRNVDTVTTYPNCQGVVTPQRPRNVMRNGVAEWISQAITIHTRERLTSSKTGITADIITWNGNQYTITDVDDLTHFGNGFIVATGEFLGVIPTS